MNVDNVNSQAINQYVIQAYVKENIPSVLSWPQQVKEWSIDVCRNKYVVKLFTFIPKVNLFELKKYRALADLITTVWQVFEKNPNQYAQLTTTIYGGDKLESLEKLKHKQDNQLISKGSENTQFYFTTQDTLGAAGSLHSWYENLVKKVAIVNLANRQQSGGVGMAPFGGSQEEFLVRRSNLIWSISEKFNQSLKKDLHQLHKDEKYQLSANHHIPYFGTILSKNVTFIPSAIENGDSPGRNLYDVISDVISVAAPDLRQGSNEDQFFSQLGDNKKREEAIREVLKHKIQAIFSTAIEAKSEHLILGAFGCGCFKNDPETMATVFTEVLKEHRYENRFKSITFAITEQEKLVKFKEVFKKTFKFIISIS